jgi:beta-xylosidase
LLDWECIIIKIIAMKKNRFPITLSVMLFCTSILADAQTNNRGWVADNGNGTYTNPLFFEDTPDPCMIRVGEDYFLTCSSMHLMPGLPIMHSKDLVNWELINYAFARINPGAEYSFTDGKDAYGNGIWAPSFVYNKGVYYIFANVNNHGTQVFKTTDPYGEWEHYEMKRSFHDLSVFFDDDGKVYVCWGYKNVELAQLNDELTDIIPDTHKIITHEGAEGSHMYKINWKYYIIWSVPGPNTPMLAGVADNPYGPYRVEKICNENHTGVHSLPWLKESPRERGTKFDFWGYDPNGFVTMHQGGLIDTPDGEYWGYVMQDHTSLGRNTSLSPITWQDDIPYFGLPGNLAQTPKVWIKPNLPQQPIRPLVQRSDDFSSAKLGMQWQWNHLPDDTKWSLKNGKLRLQTLPAPHFWNARNSLTQRIVGLESDATVQLEMNGLKTGDVAGLALLIYPYSWIGVEKTAKGVWLKMTNQMSYPSTAAVDSLLLESRISSVLLRTHIDIDYGKATFAYSLDSGKNFKDLGNALPLHFQLYTFQGARITLFAYNNKQKNGGYADFDDFSMNEKYPCGFRRPIPYGQTVTFTSCKLGTNLQLENQSEWTVEKLPLGRVALKADGKYLSIQAGNNFKARLIAKEQPAEEEIFQWMELEGSNLVLMSLASKRYLSFDEKGEIYANTISPNPNRKEDSTRFEWFLSKI